MKRCAATPCNEVKLRNNLFLEPYGFTRCRMSFARPGLQKKKKQTKNTTFEKYVMNDSPNQLSTEKSH